MLHCRGFVSAFALPLFIPLKVSHGALTASFSESILATVRYPGRRDMFCDPRSNITFSFPFINMDGEAPVLF